MSLVLIVLLLALGLADCITTKVGLGRASVSEGNPVAAWLMRRIGVVPAMLLLKIGSTALAIIVAVHWPIAGVLFVLGYLYVIHNNVRILRG